MHGGEVLASGGEVLVSGGDVKVRKWGMRCW